MLAKSDGTKLIEHSKLVNSIALDIFNKTFINKNDEKLKNIIHYSSLLHDIGKCCKHFQALLKKEKCESEKPNKIKFLHNEIGFAFLYNYLNVSENIIDDICNTVYWHHGILNKMSEHRCYDILKNVGEDNINEMKNFINDVLGEGYIRSELRDNYKKTPTYYTDNKDKNIYLIEIRTCVFVADRQASKKSTTKELFNSIDRIENYDLSKFPYDDVERFNKQKEIAIDSYNEKSDTVVVKAPAGYGKTITGLLWSLNNNKKTIWVCPRNAVAHSVYQSIINELKQFNTNTRVELFLSSEVKDCNWESSGFDSDIIVTNIDNFLNCTSDNRHVHRLFSITNYNVIFDEFHELCGDVSIFPLFILIMNLRHNLTNSKTLLLSATPLKLNELWDTLNNGTKILPNEETHYKAIHSKPYKVNFIDGNLNKLKRGGNTLYILNTIKNSQRLKNLNKDYFLLHSHFEKSKRIIMFNDLLKTYGKKNRGDKNKGSVISTHILQASLDISFDTLYESVLSPESTLQRIGRCNRWGEYEMSEINFFNLGKSEDTIKNILYDRNLNFDWFNFMKINIKDKITLDELYNLYNKFTKEYSDNIEHWVKVKFLTSLDKLPNIYPFKVFNKSKKTDVISAGSNILRSSGNEIFYIVKLFGEEKYSDVFNHKIHDTLPEDFGEDGNSFQIIKNTIQSLVSDERYDYDDIVNSRKWNKIRIDELVKCGRKSNTPYVRLNALYHNDFGVIEKELLETFNNN